MNPVRFVFCLHIHQPLGNFDQINESAYARAYLPYLELAAEFPDFRFSLHVSGCLLEWIETRHPEYFELLRRMVERGQVEPIGGAMYEPILPIWPPTDTIEQVKLHALHTARLLGVRPAGMWIPERVWEPRLATTLHAAGMRYLALDDDLVRAARPGPEDLARPVATGPRHRRVAVLPIAERLRYIIPFRPPAESIRYLRGMAHRYAEPVVTYADDGEKFGSWPGTHRHVFGRGWLRRFIRAVLKEGDWIQMCHPGEVAGRPGGYQNVHLPGGSYREMIQWADAARRSVGGERDGDDASGWRWFLEKYGEPRRLYRLINALPQDCKRSASKGHEAHTHLLRAQCNCAYWHGVFGGLYLPHLRSALYEQIGRAAALCAPAKPKVVRTRARQKRDAETLLLHPDYTLQISPVRGGALDLLLQHDPAFNWGCTLTRRREAYHGRYLRDRRQASQRSRSRRKARSAPVPETVLAYDGYERGSLIDHFLGPRESLANFVRSRHRELGDFIDGPYREVRDQEAGIILTRKGTVRTRVDAVPVTVQKRIEPASAHPAFDVVYSVHAQAVTNVRFGVEWNLTALAPRGPDRWVEVNDAGAGEPEAQRVHADVASFRLVDRWGRRAIRVSVSQRCSLWRFGLRTITRSVSGFESIYQQTVFLALFDLPPERSLDVRFRVGFEKL